MGLGKIKGAFGAKKIRQGQKMDMQRVAFNPLARIEQTPHALHPGRHLHAKGILNGQDAAHLVGHRTNAADTGDDVGDFRGKASLKEFFKKAWRLKNAQMQRLDPAIDHFKVQGAFTFNARQCRHVNVNAVGHDHLQSCLPIFFHGCR